MAFDIFDFVSLIRSTARESLNNYAGHIAMYESNVLYRAIAYLDQHREHLEDAPSV